MNTNLQIDFESSKNPNLKKEVEKLLANSSIDLVAIFSKARNLTLADASKKPSQYKQRNYMAENMYGNVIGLLDDNFSELMQRDKYNRPYISLSKNIRIYVKKLTDKYLPSNVKTKHVNQLNGQELFEQSEHVHVLYAGFILDGEDWLLDFKEVCISYINRVYTKIAAWIIDLREQRFRKSTTLISYLDIKHDEADTLVKVPNKGETKSS